jgi:DNA-binding NarL/FixJ family response regulator
VLVIENQVLFAKALCKVLATDVDLTIVGDAGAVSDSVLRQAKPNLILIDLDHHPVDIEETVRLCRASAADARICVLSMRSEPAAMRRCLSAGAEGYVMKDITPSELCRAIKTVASGSSYVDPRIAGSLLRRQSDANGRHSTLYDLSDREVDIMRLIADGLSNKEISGRLNLSEKTVKNHISRIFSKLNICARSQAAVYAIKNGLV